MDQEHYEDADYEGYEHGEEGEEIEIEAIGIDVSSQPIELYKVFKIANLVSGGGEAKHIISEGYVAVNGELETRKRRKMYDGDFFEFNQEYYVVVCDQPVQEDSEKPKKKEAPKQNNKAKKGQSKKGSSKKESQRSTADMLSAKAEPKKEKKEKKKENKPKKKADTPKPTRDDKSGRNSIEFF
ncbi:MULTISPECIES: RNA-binding S4 domain-containing protein [unclassified Vibrio]|uniref:RNA-binding S4 domain-containing protein n=1 Tax=unclassified Vibrio TaxID=2614977 RepID=UPI00159DE49D|nr:MULTISPECIES: RNA-binding S4 domain-containing protein [unclassified Vibrio]NVN81073.1 RNA-binding S4 domain-containing protein [Vibrio sp. Scap16]QLE95136.1 RNA-binding S4 domain-containing protein [Vibrio sp. Scap24]